MKSSRFKQKSLAPLCSMVFLDVDGCLLDFETLLLARMAQAGLTTPTPAQMATRSHDYICESFPHVVARDREWVIVADVFAKGDLKTQGSYHFLNKPLLSRLLTQNNVTILTKLDPNYVADRRECLLREFGVDLAGKILSVWGSTTKGERMLEFCEENGLDITRTTLVDDRHDNLETALRLGASGLLVERSYNETHRGRMTAEYAARFSSVPHHLLAERIHDTVSTVAVASAPDDAPGNVGNVRNVGNVASTGTQEGTQRSGRTAA